MKYTKYTFTAQSYADKQFKAFPKAIQNRMIALWNEFERPKELAMNIEQWNPERRPGMGRFDITVVFPEKTTLQYELFRKKMISGCDL